MYLLSITIGKITISLVSVNCLSIHLLRRGLGRLPFPLQIRNLPRWSGGRAHLPRPSTKRHGVLFGSAQPYPSKDVGAYMYLVFMTSSSPSNVISLFPEQRLVQDALDNRLAENTRSSYASRMRVIRAWFDQRGENLDPEGFTRFLAVRASEGAGSETLVGYWNAYQDAAGDALTVSEKAIVAQVVRGLLRAARGYQPTKARALSADEILQISLACPDNAGGRLDRAMILLGVSLGLRASDLRTLQRDDLTVVAGQGLSVRVRYSKTDQLGQGVDLALPRLPEPLQALDACSALESWLEVLDRTDAHAPLFRGLYRGRTTIRPAAMSARAVGDLIENACERAGVHTDGVSAHSLRASFATGAYAAGIPEREIARTGRWASVTTQRAYDRATAWQNPASAWLGQTFAEASPMDA